MYSKKFVSLGEDELQNISHDLKNPLGIIRLAVEILRSKTESNGKITYAELKDLILRIDYAANKIEGIINNIIDQSKIDSGQV